MKLLNYSISYLVENNTPQPPKRPYTDFQLRILCRVIRQRKITREYCYKLISEVYQYQSVRPLSYEEMYWIIPADIDTPNTQIVYFYGGKINEFVFRNVEKYVKKNYKNATTICLKGKGHCEDALLHSDEWIKQLDKYII